MWDLIVSVPDHCLSFYFTTDWFSVNCGLKRGCSLSPLLFNLYINDLAFTIDALGKGVKTGDYTVSILFYADEVVLKAESEPDFQSMLDIMGSWCKNNLLSINASKSNFVHFRNPSVQYQMLPSRK